MVANGLLHVHMHQIYTCLRGQWRLMYGSVMERLWFTEYVQESLKYFQLSWYVTTHKSLFLKWWWPLQNLLSLFEFGVQNINLFLRHVDRYTDYMQKLQKKSVMFCKFWTNTQRRLALLLTWKLSPWNSMASSLRFSDYRQLKSNIFWTHTFSH